MMSEKIKPSVALAPQETLGEKAAAESVRGTGDAPEVEARQALPSKRLVVQENGHDRCAGEKLIARGEHAAISSSAIDDLPVAVPARAVGVAGDNRGQPGRSGVDLDAVMRDLEILPAPRLADPVGTVEAEQENDDRSGQDLSAIRYHATAATTTSRGIKVAESVTVRIRARLRARSSIGLSHRHLGNLRPVAPQPQVLETAKMINSGTTAPGCLSRRPSPQPLFQQGPRLMKSVARLIERVVNTLVVLFLLTGAARADCMSADQWLAKVGDAFAPAAVIIDHSDLADDLRAAAAGEFNGTPPIREPIMPGRAIVVVAKSVRTGFPLPFVLIGFFVRDCAAGTLQVPIAVPATEADNG